MAESKEDYEARIAAAHREAQKRANVQTAKIDGKAGEILSHLHDGEPVFVFRAKDMLSSFALQAYQHMVDQFNPASEHSQSINKALTEFRRWQVENPGKVKFPD